VRPCASASRKRFLATKMLVLFRKPHHSRNGKPYTYTHSY
jgi:hypothetical protein